MKAFYNQAATILAAIIGSWALCPCQSQAQEAATATFDDIDLGTATYLIGPTDDSTFRSGDYTFHTADYGGWWCGHAVSADKSADYTSINDQYRSAAGGGLAGSQFCVAYPQGPTLGIDVENAPEGRTLRGMYVTNTAWAYTNMTVGDAFARKFAAGDWFKLTINGVAADGSKTKIDYYLADLRSDNEADHYILNQWQWVDLSALGPVVSVWMQLDSSDSGQWGCNTAAYVAIDNFDCPAPDASAIAAAPKSASDKVAGYYTLGGRRIQAPQHGICIVKYADGRSEKVVR